MALSLTELLLLILVIAGAVYVGYLIGRWSVLKEGAHGAGTALPPIASPLPGPGDEEETIAPPRRSAAPPPASAGGTHADAGGGAPRPRSAAPPPASAGGSGPGGLSGGTGEPRRTVAPPPARAGLLDPGSGSAQAGKGGKPKPRG